MRIVTTVFFFFSSRRRHTRYWRDWSSDVCSSDLSREEVQRALSGPTFRVYTNDDVAGTELGGAVKNVLAIAAGMVSGLGLGTNSVAALVTRGLAAMMRLAFARGARGGALIGLAGLGGLGLTCTRSLSCNRYLG